MSALLRFSKNSLRIYRGYATVQLQQQERNALSQAAAMTSERNKKWNSNQQKLKAQNPQAQNPQAQNPQAQILSFRPFEISMERIHQKVFHYDFVEDVELKQILSQIKLSGYLPENIMLYLLHACGNHMCYKTSNEQRALIDEVWTTLKECGCVLDISMYNALLQVYTETETTFSAENLLQDMEKNNVKPNRVTFDKLVHYYCTLGDMKGATEILNIMNEKGISLSTNIFNSLIIGHSKTGDEESAFKLLDVMEKGNIEKDANTYGALMQIYAQSGNIEKIREIITDCENKEIALTESQFGNVIIVLACNGHSKHIPEIMVFTRHSKKLLLDMVSAMFKLTEKEEFDKSIEILKYIPLLNMKPFTRNCIIESLVDRVVKDKNANLNKLCEHISKCGIPEIYNVALRRCIHYSETGLAMQLLKGMNTNNEPVNEDFFRPLLSPSNNFDIEAKEIVIKSMISHFNVQPSLHTLTSYYIPFIPGTMYEIFSHLLRLKVETSRAANAVFLHALRMDKFSTPVLIVKNYPNVTIHPAMMTPMARILDIHGDYRTYVEFARYVNANHDDVYTLPNEKPRHIDQDGIHFNDFVVSQAALSLPTFKNEIFYNVLETMKLNGLGITKKTADKIAKLYNRDNITKALNELTAEDLKPKPVDYPFFKKEQQASRLLRTFCEEGDVEKATAALEEMKASDSLNMSVYGSMISLHLARDEIKQAKQYMAEATIKYPEEKFRRPFILKYALKLITSGDAEEAIQFLKDNYDSYEAQSDERCKQLEINISKEIASLENDELQRSVLAMFSSSKMECMRQILRHHLNKGNAEKAYETFVEFFNTYRKTPLKFELMKYFIEKEDVQKLQALTNICATVHGEMEALFNLILVFLECGKKTQAKKLITTPGFELTNNFFANAASLYKFTKKLDYLNDLLEITRDCKVNRQQLFEIMLEPCITLNDCERGLSLWVQMQEENLIPSKTFLDRLAEMLRRNNQPVPFAASS